MSETTALERECRTFGTYLLGTPPTPYVLEKYLHAHAASEKFSSRDPFDRLLVRVARKHPSLTRVVDAYAALLAPRSLVRRKLVLLLAILETCAPSSRSLAELATGGRIALLARLSLRVVISAFSFLLGAILFLPPRLLLARKTRP